jgi:hypothetical protein
MPQALADANGGWFIWFLWFFSFVWLDQRNQTNRVYPASLARYPAKVIETIK